MALNTITFAANNAHTFQLATALTTVFSPGPSCFSYIYQDPETFRYAGGELPECFPTAMSFQGPKTTAAYYSPGRCPNLWTPYRVTDPIPGVKTIADNSDTSPDSDGDHVFFCCPSPMYPNDLVDQGCVTSIRTSTSIEYHSYDQTTGYDPNPTGSVLSDKFPYQVVGYGFQIRFRNSDLKALNFNEEDMKSYGLGVAKEVATDSSSGSGSAKITASADSTASGTESREADPANTTSSNSATTSSQSSPSSSGITNGTKIAIAVCVPLFFLCCGLGAWVIYLLQRNRRRRSTRMPDGQILGPPAPAYHTNNNSGSVNSSGYGSKVEAHQYYTAPVEQYHDSRPSYSNNNRYPLYPNPTVTELPNNMQWHELPGNEHRHELPTGR